MRQWMFLSACAALTGCFSSRSVYAEGHTDFGGGAIGVNRVIRTKNGYGVDGANGYLAVGGTVKLDFAMPTDKNGQYSNRVNPYNNKPSAYLGGRFRSAAGVVIRYVENSITREYRPGAGELIEADLGLQFEPNTDPRFISLGWTAFASVHRGLVNPQFWNAELARSEPWRGRTWRPGTDRVPGTGSTTTSMEFRVIPAGQPNDGLRLTVGGLGSFYFNQAPGANVATSTNRIAPSSSERSIAQSDQTASSVKRVIAMTRAKPANAELDGSWMRGLWSGCWVVNSTTHHWPALDVNQDARAPAYPSATGYDAPGDIDAAGDLNLLAWDSRLPDGGRTAGQSHTIVEFDGNPTENLKLRAPAVNGIPYDPTDPTRYTTETVTINLKTVTQLLGQPVQIP